MATKTPIRKVKTPTSFKDLTIPAEVLKGAVGLSQSLVITGLQCDRQLIYALNRWEKPGKEQNTFFGSCAHEMLDVFYTLKSKPDEKQIDEALTEYLAKQQETGALDWLNPSERAYQECILTITLAEYFDFYHEDFNFKFHEVETKFAVKYNGLTLVGKKDGKVEDSNKKIWLFEHKTKGEINEEAIIRNLDINFQTQFYLLADRIATKRPCHGVLYNLIRRTKTRPKGKETLREFGERLRSEIQRDPDYFFRRLEAEYTKQQTEEFEFELKLKLARIHDLFTGKRPALKNEAFCMAGFECDFAQACASNSLEGYRQRSVVSPELV